MGNLKGMRIQKGRVGPNTTGPITSTTGLMFNGANVPGKLDNNVPVKVTSVAEAEALGLTSDYDKTNDVVVHQHIVEFYSMAIPGTVLWLMVTNAASPSAALEDATGIYAKKMIIAAEGKLRQIGLAWNVSAEDDETITDGFNSDIRAAIPKGQLLHNWSYETDRPVHVVLEGRSASDTLTALIDLRAIPAGDAILHAPKVSVVIGQDWEYAEARRTDPDVADDSKVHLYASVGKFLGTLASAEMNQSTAEVAAFNLSDATRGYFLIGGLSNHKKIADQEASLQGLEDKGYIFPITFNSESVSGYRWNNDHCCVPIIIDADGNINEHMIYYGRTSDECVRSLRDAYLNRLKQRVGVDPSTGKLSTAVRKNLESEGNLVFTRFAQRGYLVDGRSIINPDSDLVNPPKSLLISFEFVPTSIIDNIDAKINIVKSFQI